MWVYAASLVNVTVAMFILSHLMQLPMQTKKSQFEIEIIDWSNQLALATDTHSRNRFVCNQQQQQQK